MSKEREGANIDATTAARGAGAATSSRIVEGRGVGKQHISIQQHPYTLQEKGGMHRIDSSSGLGGPLVQTSGNGFQQHHIQAGRHVAYTQATMQPSSMFHGNNSNMVMMTMRNINTTTPCAACKLLRRRCAQECPFAPYFSPHEPQRFASVHKVYGASNVSKMLLEVPEMQRVDAANSLVYEANARLRDPIYGCMGVVSTLQQQAQALQAELNAVKVEVMRYRACHVQEGSMQHHLAPSSHSSGFTNPSIPTTPPLDHHPPPTRGHPLPTTTLEPTNHYLSVSHPSTSTPPTTLAHAIPSIDNTDTKDRLISWP